MNFAFIPVISSKKLVVVAAALLSVLLVAYSPMVAIGHAETAANLQKLKELKQKEIDELTRRITDLESTQKSLADSVAIDKDGKSAAAFSTTGVTNGFVEMPLTLKTQVKEYNQKIIDELKQLLTKAQSTTSLEDAQAIAKNIDTQAPLSFISNIQGAVTNSIESLTGVLDNVKSSTGDLQGQVTKIKDCASNSSTSTVADCDGLKASADTATAAQDQLGSISTIISTITSVLMSAISLLLTLITTFVGMIGGLGGGGGLSSIGNLGSLSSAGDLSSITGLAGGMGSFTSLLGPLTSITSQLDIGNLMSGNALGSLGNLTSLINI